MVYFKGIKYMSHLFTNVFTYYIQCGLLIVDVYHVAVNGSRLVVTPSV